MHRFKYVFIIICIVLLLVSGCRVAEVQPPDETEPPILSVVMPSPSPEPSPTPIPNPYVGQWTIEGRAFSISFQENLTFFASLDETERSGTYSFDADGIALDDSSGEPIIFDFLDEADALQYRDLLLIRSDVVPEKKPERIPVTFEAENDDVRVSVRGAVVEATAIGKTTVQQYCFTNAGCTPPDDSRDWFDVSDAGAPATSFRVFKFDGEYTLWIRDAEDRQLSPIDVTVASGFLYPIWAEGVEPIHVPLGTFLGDNGSSVDELNDAIGADVAAAGVYTRQGVVTAGVSLISNMAKYGASVVYQGHGSYQNPEDWGINPEWGSKLKRPTSDANGTYKYAGMQCVASIVWAYKQAGVNLCSDVGSEIGTIGERERKKDNTIDYDRAESGDIIRIRNHYQMVVDRLDTDGDGKCDSYLTYEMWAPHLTLLTLTFRQIRARTVFSMDAVFENAGRNLSKTKYWEDTFLIPQEAFPTFLSNAVRTELLDKEWNELLCALGF